VFWVKNDFAQTGWDYVADGHAHPTTTHII